MKLKGYLNREKQKKATHGSALVLMLLWVCVFTVKQVLEHVAAIITTICGQWRGPTAFCESMCVFV